MEQQKITPTAKISRNCFKTDESQKVHFKTDHGIDLKNFKLITCQKFSLHLQCSVVLIKPLDLITGHYDKKIVFSETLGMG